MYETAIIVCAIAAGATAAVSGVGIGTLMTPLLAPQADTKTAVAAVSIPHLVGTLIRFWRLRGHVDRGVLWRFGLMSAAGAGPDRDGRRDCGDAQRRAAPGEGAGTTVQAGGGSDYPVAGDRDSAAPKPVRRPREDRWPG
jgi:hypothetical protein